MPVLALTAPAANAQGAWFDVPPVSVARATLAGAAAPCPEAADGSRKQVKDACVYAFGGLSASPTGQVTVYDTVEAFDHAANDWTALAPLPTARGRLAGAAAPCPTGLNGSRGAAKETCVYAIGGSNLTTDFLNTVEALAVGSGNTERAQ
ncbi:hypothetical protein [Streptomyces sp. TS71-3]|uniref:hypothetical protein n=1 Tax=Streptomyces sp. TS71-3 TaxID=2733862 RepID=UPI001BB32676|nr:hypothetical protein [Streptomyces sp. TS71-3]